MASEARRFSAAVLLSLVTLTALPAAADPSLSEKETARSAMEEGDAKRDKNDLKGALKSYEAADAIMHVPTTGLEVARTQAALGMLLEARETSLRVSRLPVKPNEPPPFVAARKAAEQLSSDLAARIPSITVAFANVEPGQTPQLVFDGEAVPLAAQGAPRKVNPNIPHTIVAKTASAEKKETVTVQEKEQRTVTIDFKAPVAAVPPTPPVGGEQPQPQPEKPSQGGGIGTGKILMFGGFAVAVIGIGVGSVTGLMSISKESDLEPKCPGGKCPSSVSGDLDSVKSLGTISTISFIVGGVGAGVGVLGLVLSKNESKEQASIRPVVGPTWLGAAGTF